MKSVLFLVLAVGTLSFQTASASEGALFDVIGVAHISGSLLQDCSTLAMPTASEAQANADQQAAEQCATSGLTAVRVTDFTNTTNNCVWGGPQYQYPSNNTYADAQYSCQ